MYYFCTSDKAGSVSVVGRRDNASKVKKLMSNHLGKRERAAGKRHKSRSHSVAYSNANGSGSLTLKLGSRKWKKINLQKLFNVPF